MKSVYRWIANHTGLCRGILFLGLTAFTIFAASLEYVSFLSVYLIDLFIWLLVGHFIAAVPAKLLQEPIELVDQQCDPYPLLQELEQQMARKSNTAQGQLTELNYAMALRTVGQNQKAASTLESINIDRFPSTSPYTKYIYYNNLSDVLFALDRVTEARIWHRKAVQIYNDLPENKMKQQLSETCQISHAEALYYEGDYSQALQKAAWIKCRSKRQLLDTALLAAKCHIALEEPEKAREKLQYVVDNGNSLHIVEESKALLENLS